MSIDYDEIIKRAFQREESLKKFAEAMQQMPEQMAKLRSAELSTALLTVLAIVLSSHLYSKSSLPNIELSCIFDFILFRVSLVGFPGVRPDGVGPQRDDGH